MGGCLMSLNTDAAKCPGKQEIPDYRASKEHLGSL
jgi:hypothetical protein